MTEEQLAKLERLANAATPGPWETNEDWTHEIHASGRGILIGNVPRGPEPYGRAGDAAFIAASRSAVPALVAEVRRLRELLDWIDRGGGLGLDVHQRIRAALGKDGES